MMNANEETTRDGKDEAEEEEVKRSDAEEKKEEEKRREALKTSNTRRVKPFEQ